MSKIEQLREALVGMDLPVNRILACQGNFRWLKRNMWIRNSKHKNFSIADRLLDELITVDGEKSEYEK